MAEGKSKDLFEDYSVKSVPQEETKNWLSMGLIWAGVGISLGLLLTGGTIGNGLTLGQASIAALIGGGVLALITILVGIIGAKTNLSTAMISRFTFGNRAIIIIALVQALGSYGWFAVQLGLFGKTSSTSWEMATGLGGSTVLFTIIGGICMVFTAMIGYKALDFLSKLAVPLLLLLMGASVWKILENHSFSDIMSLKGTGEPITIGMGISMVISSFIVGAVVAPDVSRYAKSPKDTIGAAILAFVIVVPIVMVVGALMAQIAETWDIVDIMLRLGWGAAALVVLLLAQWTSNDNNLYCSALGFSVVFTKLKKWQLTVISGILGIILAVLGIYDNFVSWLMVLGVLIPPMGGVIATDYYLFNKQHYFTSNLDRLINIRTVPVVAWIIGSIVSFVTNSAIFTITTVPAFDGFLVAAIVHFGVTKFSSGDSKMFAKPAHNIVEAEMNKSMEG
ncbi:cytosine permease [Bacillus sp. M6-12]|uniref:cytosine permease n=1 Tax=Bacillus sp. M6-12 TaxID=2054166 RepID=UPI000C772D28|nr:cytosine permease [Bacillus sp. M6-12]PLS18126.1 cytosine permease [Bacillus sp. M6-12]